MHRSHLVFLLTLLPSLCFGQYNLVPNPSFEQCTICPNGPWGQIDNLASQVNVSLPGWNNPNMSTPDYFKPGFDPNFIPPDGIAFVGMWIIKFNTTDENQREYIQCEFIDTLVNKENYLIEFYINVNTDMGNFYVNNIGLLIGDTIIENPNLNPILTNVSLKYFNNEIIITPGNSFFKYACIYESHGTEKFMTFGVFDSTLNTNVICTNAPLPAAGGAYAVIDKFSVTPLDSIPGGLQVSAGQDYSICPGDTIFIGEKISNLPANWYLLDGTVVDTNTAGVYVDPTVTTTYVVTLNINGVYSTDTVTVNVGCAGIDEPEKPTFTIGPNPNDGDFTLTGQITKGQTIKIKTMDGKVVYSKKMVENSEQQKIHSNLGSGVYFIIIEDESNHLLSQNKFVVTK